MNISPIKTESDYDAALAEIDRLMDADPNTPCGDRLGVLTTLVEAYEAKHWRVDAPDPIDAITLRMNQGGLTRTDLRRILGVGSGRVSEILRRKRALSVEMMRRLLEELDIPAESLLQSKKRTARTGRIARRSTESVRTGASRSGRSTP